MEGRTPFRHELIFVTAVSPDGLTLAPFLSCRLTRAERAPHGQARLHGRCEWPSERSIRRHQQAAKKGQQHGHFKTVGKIHVRKAKNHWKSFTEGSSLSGPSEAVTQIVDSIADELGLTPRAVRASLETTLMLMIFRWLQCFWLCLAHVTPSLMQCPDGQWPHQGDEPCRRPPGRWFVFHRTCGLL